MVGSAVLEGRTNIAFRADSGVVSAPAGGGNFTLSASRGEIANYAREGGDLVIEFTNGQKVVIRGFFDNGAGYHNLVLSNGDTLQIVDFSKALTAAGDGIAEAGVVYDAIASDSNSTSMLLGILGGVAALGGLAAAAGGSSGGSDTPSSPTPTVVPPPSVTSPADVNSTTPTLAGTGTPGATIKIFSAGTEIGSAVVDGSGDWSITLTSALTDGIHNLTVTATDANGNTSTDATFTLTVDTIAPADPVITSATDDAGSITGALSSGDVTDDATPTFEGTGEPGSTIRIVDAGGTEVGSAVVDANGDWSITTSTLADGIHNLTITATDAAGNASGNVSFALTVDTTPPAVPAITSSPVANTVNPTLAGTGTPGATIKIFSAGTEIGSAVVDGSGNWSITLTSSLADGVDHNLTVTATDAAGNVSGDATFTLTVDTIAPVDPVINSATDDAGSITGALNSGDVTDDATPTFEGTGEPGSTIRIVDAGGTEVGSAVVDANGDWSITTSALVDGIHNLTITATDAAGNASGNVSFTLTVDTTAPANLANIDAENDETDAPIAANGHTNDTTPTFSGDAGTAEAGATITVKEGATTLGTAVVGADGKWTFTVPDGDALGEGSHTLSFTITDKAGNASAGATDFTVVVDTTAPAAIATITGIDDDSGLSNNDYVTSDGDGLTIKGTIDAALDAGEKVQVRIDNGTWVDATVTGTSWTYDASSLTAEGSHQVEVRTIDLAGNVTNGSGSQTIEIDTTAPAAIATITGIDDDNGWFNNDYITSDGDGLTIKGTIDVALGAGEKVQVRIDNGTWVDATVTGTSWTYDASSLTAEGSHQVEVRTIDQAGNVTNGSGSQTIEIDTTAPAGTAVTIASISDDTGNNTGDFITTDTTLTVNGALGRSLTADERVEIALVEHGETLGDSDWQAVTTASGVTSWSFTHSGTLDLGSYTMHVRVTDKAGNTDTVVTKDLYILEERVHYATAVPKTIAISDDAMDSLIFNLLDPGSATGGNGVVTVDDTDEEENAVESGADWFDISALLQGSGVNASNVDQYIKLEEGDPNSTGDGNGKEYKLSIDRDGAGGDFSWAHLITFANVDGVSMDLDDLITNQQLVYM